MKFEICHSLIQKKNKTKHDNSTNHNNFSNLILNKFLEKDENVLN